MLEGFGNGIGRIARALTLVAMGLQGSCSTNLFNAKPDEPESPEPTPQQIGCLTVPGPLAYGLHTCDNEALIWALDTEGFLIAGGEYQTCPESVIYIRDRLHNQIGECVKRNKINGEESQILECMDAQVQVALVMESAHNEKGPVCENLYSVIKTEHRMSQLCTKLKPPSGSSSKTLTVESIRLEQSRQTREFMRQCYECSKPLK